MENIICFDSDGNSICNLVQWDKDQEVYVDDFFNGVVPEAHFALQTDKNNSYKYDDENTTKLVDGKIRIIIPNEFLLVSTKLYIFLYYHLSSSYTTKFVITLPIKQKPQPQDYKYEENLNGVSLETFIEEIGNTVFDRVNTDLTEQINTATAQIQDVTSVKLGDINNTAIAQINTINTTAQAQSRALESQGNKLLEQIGYIPALLQITTGTLSDMIDVENFDSIIIDEVVIDGWHLEIGTRSLYLEKYVNNIQTDRILIKNENTTLDISDCDGIKFETSYQGGTGYESTINYFLVKYDIKKTLSNLNNDVNNLSNISASGIICSANGENIHIKDASDKRIVSQKVFGKSTQNATTGAQLLGVNKNEYFHKYAFEIENLDISGNSIFTFPNGSTENVTTTNTRFLVYKLPVEKGKIYTITGTNEGVSVLVTLSIYPPNTQSINDREQILVTLKNTSYTFTTEDKDYMLEFRTPQASEGEVSTDKTTITLMLNEGSTVLPWEPYTGGQASPNPDYPQVIESVGDDGSVKVSVNGINQINPMDLFGLVSGQGLEFTKTKDGLLINGTCTQIIDIRAMNADRNRYIVKNKTSLSISNNLGLGAAFVIKTGETSRYITSKNGILSYSLKENEEFQSIFFRVEEGMSFNNDLLQIMINDGTEGLPWEPYRNQSFILSTPDGLPGIPVSSDGNYTDENGQQWICDTIERYADGTGKRIQRIGVIDNNDWKISNVLDGTQGERYKIECDIRHTSPVLCTHYGYKKNIVSYTDEGDYISSEESGRIFIRCSGRLFGSTEAFVEMAKSENMKTCYILKTPIETQLTAEELAEFEKLHTYKSTTNITTDCDAGIEIEYVADTKTYIDNKFNELATSMMSQNK